MKKKLSTLVLALGITASPVFAKQQSNNRRAANKAPSGVEQKGDQKKANISFKKFLEAEAEKMLIKEAESEISEVINNQEKLKYKGKREFEIAENEVVLSEEIPTNGIDISAEFKALRNLN